MQEYEQKKFPQTDRNSDDEIDSLKRQIKELTDIREENEIEIKRKDKKISELSEKDQEMEKNSRDLKNQIFEKEKIIHVLEKSIEQLEKKNEKDKKVLEGYSESERLWNLFLSLETEVRESLGFISSAGRLEFIVTLFDRGSVDRLYEWLACRLSRNDEAVRAVLELYSAAVSMY